MTDHLQEFFARSRSAALPAIRPPGAAAARRTVRRRRRARTVAVAVAAVLAVGAVPLLTGQVADRRAPLTAPVAGAAHAAVLGGGPRTPAVEFEGPVYDGYERRVQVYVPSLTLRIACAGTGRFTVVVNGRPDERGPSELARARVRCGDRPVAVQREFTLPSPITSEVVVRLVDAGTAAAGRARFAYRLTGPRAVPGVGPDSPANSPVEALSRPGEVLRDTAAGAMAPSYGWREVGPVSAVAGRRHVVVVACSGRGLVHLQMQGQDGIPVAEWDVPCSWPPQRHDHPVDKPEPGATLWMRYESEEKVAGVFASGTVAR